MQSTNTVTILGIRHHGVGSALNVKKRLLALQPDHIIIEAPIEIMEVVNNNDLSIFKPPLAVLSYNPDDLTQSVYYPFAVFSPEWQGFLYAQKNEVSVVTADLPLKFSFGLQNKEDKEEKKEIPTNKTLHNNPIEEIAKLAGYDNSELWWEHHFEQKHLSNAQEHFEAVLLLMTALREEFVNEDYHKNELREAFMREAIRKAIKEGKTNIVFICGAWHSPALLEHQSKKKEDTALMKKLPKTKVKSSWIPWMNSRLAWQSGYGAGIGSAGWYEHLWRYPKDDGKRWLVYVAKVFRKKGIDVSTAHIIETFNLANSLAFMRGISRIGLNEMNEAIVSVMCMGDKIQLSYIQNELTIGKKLGKLPPNTSQLPIKEDFDKKIKTYRLQVREDEKLYTLDLRTPIGLNKSLFLHRLDILEIKWASRKYGKSKGTFKEIWELKWQPEIELQIIDKGIWGNSIELASQNYIVHLANVSTDSVEIGRYIKQSLTAQLFTKIDFLIQKIDKIIGASYDVVNIIQTVIPLIEIARYSDVRKTDKTILVTLIEDLMIKINIHLSNACYGLDEKSAREMFGLIQKFHTSLALLEDNGQEIVWLDTLEEIAEDEDISYLIQGALSRILFDEGRIDERTLQTTFSKALSVAQEPLNSAFWIEGFLDGNAMILILDDSLWNILYSWLDALENETFDQLLPILRRTFSTYSPNVRQQIGNKAKTGLQTSNREEEPKEDENFDSVRALEGLMGVKRYLY